jgi:DNA-directed RNA polymerase specialized sigma24 family protein
MTIGDWLAKLESDPERAWETLYGALMQAAPGVAYETGVPPALVTEDVRQECVATLMSDPSPLKRARNDSELTCFAWGCLRNFALRHRGRSETLPLSPRQSLQVLQEAGCQPHELGPDWPLTQKQAEAVRLLREGMTIAQIARHLGIDWSSVRDRLYRAHRKLRFPTSGVEQTARRLGWVLPVFRKKLRNGDELSANILLYHVQGVSHAGIAARLKLTRDAVRQRLRRMRRTRPLHDPP